MHLGAFISSFGRPKMSSKDPLSHFGDKCIGRTKYGQNMQVQQLDSLEQSASPILRQLSSILHDGDHLAQTSTTASELK